MGRQILLSCFEFTFDHRAVLFHQRPILFVLAPYYTERASLQQNDFVFNNALVEQSVRRRQPSSTVSRGPKVLFLSADMLRLFLKFCSFSMSFCRHLPLVSSTTSSDVVQLLECGMRLESLWCNFQSTAVNDKPPIDTRHTFPPTAVSLFEILFENVCAKHLRFLDLGNCVDLSEDNLTRMLKYCPNITYLDLRDCEKIGDRTLKLTCEILPRLEYLNISNLSKVSNDGLLLFAHDENKQRKMRVFRFVAPTSFAATMMSGSGGGSKTVSDLGLAAIAENLVNLESLDLSCHKSMSSIVLHLALTKMPWLRRIDLMNNSGINAKGIEAIGKTLIKSNSSNDCFLEYVNISGNDVQVDATCFDTFVRDITELAPFLHTCIFYMTNITDEGLKCIAENLGPTLRELDISACRKYTQIGLLQVAKACTGLEELDCTSPGVVALLNDAIIFTLAQNCSRLKKLAITKSAGIKSADSFSGAKFKNSLQSLNLRGCYVQASSEALLKMHLPALLFLSL